MDGTEDTQKPIKPGEEFEYKFVVPDAGTFWYHSHQNETEQMERGMYGAIVVGEKTELATDNDRVLMIDDMKLDKSNEFTTPGWFVPKIVERHDGREGDTLLISGKENPTIDVHAGQVERGGPEVIGCIHARPGPNEQVGCHGIVVMRGPMQGGRPVGLRRIHVDALLQQGARQGRVLVFHSLNEPLVARGGHTMTGHGCDQATSDGHAVEIELHRQLSESI